MSCIYFNNKQGLIFDTHEHIFPHMVGMQVRLPNDIVSDEASIAFGKLGRSVAHGNNFIGI